MTARIEQRARKKTVPFGLFTHSICVLFFQLIPLPDLFHNLYIFQERFK